MDKELIEKLLDVFVSHYLKKISLKQDIELRELINIVDKCISSQGYVIVKRDEVYCGCGKKLRTSCELCDNDCM